MISLCLRNYYVAQKCLRLRDCLTSDSQLLGLKVWATMLDQKFKCSLLALIYLMSVLVLNLNEESTYKHVSISFLLINLPSKQTVQERNN